MLLFSSVLEGFSRMLDFSQNISHHLFQPQVTSNSYNTWCVGCLHLMGLCLLSRWQAETFHEDLNESLGVWTFLQIYICVSVAIAMCTICHSLQVSSKQKQSFWWIHLHIDAFQVISLQENCHEQTISLLRNEKSETHGWYFSRCCRKVSISLLPCLLYSKWRRMVLYLFWSGAFLSPTGQKSCLYYWLLIKAQRLLCLASWFQKGMLRKSSRAFAPGIYSLLLVPIHRLSTYYSMMARHLVNRKTKHGIEKNPPCQGSSLVWL